MAASGGPRITFRVGLGSDEQDHFAMYDDQATHFDGLIRFLRKVDEDDRT
jgi:hypothetical protein